MDSYKEPLCDPLCDGLPIVALWWGVRWHEGLRQVSDPYYVVVWVARSEETGNGYIYTQTGECSQPKWVGTGMMARRPVRMPERGEAAAEALEYAEVWQWRARGYRGRKMYCGENLQRKFKDAKFPLRPPLAPESGPWSYSRGSLFRGFNSGLPEGKLCLPDEDREHFETSWACESIRRDWLDECHAIADYGRWYRLAFKHDPGRRRKPGYPRRRKRGLKRMLR